MEFNKKVTKTQSNLIWQTDTISFLFFFLLYSHFLHYGLFY
uniref:Uncharacterized protein n=1 Tax=Anguilla anguilla TaxID=7936 RepID=A0A0E9XE83_ANGAN